MSFRVFLLLNGVLWLYFHFLNFPSAASWYSLPGLKLFGAMHFYIKSIVWLVPSSGESFLFLQ